MDILSAILNAQGGGAVRQLGQNFGLGEDQAQSALSALLPMLAGAAHQNARQAGGMDALLGALGGGNHQRYLDDPSTLGSPETIQDGNGILGHLLGSKEVSRQVAARASQQTGIGADLLKKMLPVVAGMMMGGLSKQTSNFGAAASAGARAVPQQASEGLLGMLTPLLDRNRDGSAMDDILRMASGFLRR